MSEHEFYADPTIFDEWHDSAGSWFEARLEKLHSYSWVIGFSGFAGAFLLVAVAVLVHLLEQNLTGEGPSSGNQSLAQGVTVIVALLAAQRLIIQAIHTWPAHIPLPKKTQELLRLCGWTVPARAGLTGGGSRSKTATADSAVDARAVREFFAGARAAGVNVASAKALFSAGIRTAHHLCQTQDKHLLTIHGVGPATVRKLRSYFPSD